MTRDFERRLEISLLLLRLAAGLVMLVWAADKIFNPGHGAAVFKGFCGISGVGEPVVHALGIVQALIVVGFLIGFARTWTYGAVLFMHGATTLVSWSAYLTHSRTSSSSRPGRCSQPASRSSRCARWIGSRRWAAADRTGIAK
jgi:hypothetical protein